MTPSRPKAASSDSAVGLPPPMLQPPWTSPVPTLASLAAAS